MRLSVSIATRGRPDILDDTLRQYLGGTVLPDTRIHVAIDADDDVTVAYLPKLPGGGKVLYSIQPREDTRGLKHQRVLTDAPADLYLVGTDHTPVVSMGWDKVFLDAASLFHDGIGVVCTPLANQSFPYLQAVTKRWVELTGYVQPPHFPFWFIDHWTDDLATMTGRYVPVNVGVHCQRRGQTTTGMRDLAFWAAYCNHLTEERRQTALRIINALDDVEEHKAILRAAMPITLQRSIIINNGVIADHERIEELRGDKTPPEPGYLRAKARAEADMTALAA